MNKKNERIRKLWEKGTRDLSVIARKIGYNGGANTAGVERVKEGLRSLGITFDQVEAHRQIDKILEQPPQ